MTIELTIRIPELGRLAQAIDNRTAYLLSSMEYAARPEPEQELKREAPAAPEAGKPEPKAEPEPEPAPEPTEEPKAEPVPLEKIQRAAADLRDQGKLSSVTELFPTYGIRKLSDLKGEQTAAFAAELQRLGARNL